MVGIVKRLAGSGAVTVEAVGDRIWKKWQKRRSERVRFVVGPLKCAFTHLFLVNRNLPTSGSTPSMPLLATFRKITRRQVIRHLSNSPARLQAIRLPSPLLPGCKPPRDAGRSLHGSHPGFAGAEWAGY
jgi:hypothetical protein